MAVTAKSPKAESQSTVFAGLFDGGGIGDYVVG
jgi:hypothetical protein